jgi:IclR family KDG regulon transcriptional repressor
MARPARAPAKPIPIRRSDGRDQTRSLQVLERAFSILDLFTAEHPEWSTTEVSQASDLPIPTAYRILVALRRRGFVTQDGSTKRFRLGIAALELGERARVLVDIRTASVPVLRRLTRETGETALLTAVSEDHRSSVCLERVESPHPLRLSLQPGRRMPLHAGASQKVLLAYLAPDEIERVASGHLERLCRATIVDPGELRAELARIRRRGWARSFEETNVGVWGLAVPILGVHGRLIAAVGIAGPSARMSRVTDREHLARLRAAAADIAKAIGSHDASANMPRTKG